MNLSHHTPVGAILSVVLAWAASAAPAIAAGTVVPVRFEDGLPIVTVTLGRLKADFLLDTGSAAALTVPRPLVTPSAGVETLPETVRMTDAAGVVQEVARLRVAALSLGAASLGPMQGLLNYHWGLSVGDNPAPAATRRGTVGMGAFDRQAVLFELGQGRLTIDESGQAPALKGRWFRVPFTHDKRGVVVRFTDRGRSADLVLDSAATTSLLKRGAAVLSGPTDVCGRRPPEAPTCGTAVFSAGVIGEAPPTRTSFEVVTMGPLPFDGLLGIDFFKTHAVFLDLARHELLFRPAPAQSRPSRSVSSAKKPSA